MPPKAEPVEQESSMRDDFDTAIAAIENNDDGAHTVETSAAAAEQITAEDLNADEAAEEAEAKATSKAQAATAAAENEDDADGSGDTGSSADALGAGADEKTVGLDKAPASWSPAAREAWDKVPESARAQIAKREVEINKALNEGAANRKMGEKFQGIADRYAQVIAAEGAPDALTGVEELVKTVATLRMGSAEQKAQKVAGFIKHYGIDVGILDDMLTGNSAQGGRPQQPPPLDPRVESLLSNYEQEKRAKQFQENQNAINEVMSFKQEHEFYADVQNDMADMVELAEKRGIKMPLQEAYDKACALNPEIAAILEKRKADAALFDSGKTLQAKRDAASSLNGKQGGGQIAGELTMRQQIEAGFDAVG
jgi:hypothetical protein